MAPINSARAPKYAFAITALVVAAMAACAAPEVPAYDDSDLNGAPPSKASTAPSSAPEADATEGTTPASTPPAKACVTSCNMDADCATSCPVLPGGVQCCDLGTHTCWGSKTAVCPAAPDPNVDPPPAY